MKIAVYYDTLISKGGAERVAIQLANAIGADLITSGFNKDLNSWIPIKVKVRNIGNISLNVSKPIGILFEAPLRYMFTDITSEYDVNIFLGFTSIYAAKPRKNNLWFCFTPNRIMYDLKEAKLSEAGLIKKLILLFHIYLFRKQDQQKIRNMNKIISQSKLVKARVKKYYGRKSSILNSFIDVKNYKFKELGNYYLTVSRLFPEKRIDLLINAFTKMQDKKLIIVGDGPEKAKIQSMIKNTSNIQLKTSINEKELIQLYSSCIATIYMPKDEDYGLVPLESNASGKICIGVNEGGCKETIVDGISGYLIKPKVETIIKTINSLSRKKLLSMKSNSIKNADKFDKTRFIKKLNTELQNL